MGVVQSHGTGPSVNSCLINALGGNHELIAFPSKPLYQFTDVQRWNLAIEVVPAAVTYPETTREVAEIIRCATEAELKVQPKSGGHSHANYGLGGVDGSIVIDLKHFQQFSMDSTTWRATIGAGTLLGELDKRLHSHNRAMAHGTCPKVGIGGHATIGGLGPTSRQWGAALDHVEEVEVVLANSTIVRASPSQNPDLFWALKGAGASFGVITEFIVRTEPEPGKAIQFSFTFSYGSYASMAPTFKLWQEFIADPQLTRLFASEVVITQLGMVISGTYFGPKEDYEKFQLSAKFFHAQSSHVLVFDDWLGVAGHWAEEEALLLSSGLPVNLVANSLVFNETTLIPDTTINDLFKYLDGTKKGTPLWFVIFDLEGGAVNDVRQDATAYAHRDALFYMQSYAVGIGHLSETTREFIAGVNEVIEKGMPEVEFGAYAGYVDPKLENPREKYWGSNLERLERIKAVVDPEERFWNPQSVRPNKKEAGTVDQVLQENDCGWNGL